MTTTIKVSVHCTEDKEVVVQKWNANDESELVLQNNEEHTLAIYDSYKFCAFERKKLKPEGSLRGELF